MAFKIKDLGTFRGYSSDDKIITLNLGDNFMSVNAGIELEIANYKKMMAECALETAKAKLTDISSAADTLRKFIAELESMTENVAEDKHS